MKLIEQAFIEIFPEKNIEEYTLKIKYSDKFKPYNANVKYSKNSLQFNLSKKWRGVSKEIQIGILQGLLLKIFKKKKNTINIDLYNSFMKNLHIAAPKTKTDSLLETSFNKINENYFLGMMELTNLVWHNSVRRLGTYEYGSDTISISKILQEDMDVLDYVMYHEMLHKKLKFKDKNGSCRHHTKEFKEKESQFKNSSEMEQRIKNLVRQKTRKRFRLF
jgi:hypothetical protein|tara:strand:- start:2811 stop:3467 length:657 start_codon:yes stop_codon:yes gene_type:complete